jgi:quercetin dioxygenase-like cupin family protein
MEGVSIYRKSEEITVDGFGSCDVYYMRPGTHEKKHYHDGIEIVYIVKGSCRTHKEGEVYVYQKEQVHEVVNDSSEELVFVCLTIPPESIENTHYLPEND